MDAADGIILATPVYMDDVSGLMKTWIDRLAYISHRPAFGGKCAYPIATVGGSPTSHTLRTMNSALLTWGFHLVGRAGLKMGALAPASEMDRYRQRRPRLQKSYFARFLFGGAAPSFVSLMAFKIQQLAWQREPPVPTIALTGKTRVGWSRARRFMCRTGRALEGSLARRRGRRLCGS